jgi:hypothetical protein
MADALIVKDPDNTSRIKTFQEFEENYKKCGQKAFDPIKPLLRGFHPEIKPVLWLILLLQLHIYEALIFFHIDKAKDINLKSDSPSDVIPPEIISIMEKHPEDLDWRQSSDKQTTTDEVWDEPLA